LNFANEISHPERLLFESNETETIVPPYHVSRRRADRSRVCDRSSGG
jgi:hypothetical protein